MAQNSILAQMQVLISGNAAQFLGAIKQVQTQLTGFRASVEGAGKALAGYFGAQQVFRGLEAGISILADFEFKMAETKAITGAVGQEFKDLEVTARNLGKSTLYTAEQIAGLETELGRLGFSTPEIVAASKASVDLATATGEELSKATNTVGTAIRQFSLPATEATHLADVMTGAFNKTALALDDFAIAMSYVGPVANTANISFEEASSLLGILADSGIRGSQAGTALRRIIVDLAKDGRPLVERLGELAAKGITVQNSFDEVGRIGQTALIVLEKGRDRIQPLAKELRDGVGEAARVAAIRMDTLTGDTERLVGAFKNLILEGSPVSVVLRALEQTATNALNSFTDDRLSGFAKFVNLLGLLTGDVTGAAGAGKVLAKLNEQEAALNTTARKVFTTYASGFQDTSKAAKAFQDIQYSAILAAQTEQATREKTFANDKDFLEQTKAATDAEIAGRRRLIAVAAEYIRATADGADTVVPAQKRVVETIENEIKALQDLEKQVGSGDSGAYGQLEKQIAKLELELINTEAGFTKAKAAADAFFNPGVVPPLYKELQREANGLGAIDTTSIPKPGSAEAINQIHKFQEELRKTSKAADQTDLSVTKLKNTFFNTGNIIRQVRDENGVLIGQFINMGQVLTDVLSRALVGFGEAIGNAATGVADFGKSAILALASFAKQFGALLIGSALATIAANEVGVDPYAALAAGIALVALGTAAANLANKGPEIGASRSASAGARGTISSLTASPVQVTGTTIVKGQDLYVVYSNYNSNKNG